MNNKQINKIKRRADTLADYIINKVERLEKENYELYKLLDQSNFELHRYEMVFDKALGEIAEVKKRQNGMIEIYLKDSTGGKDILYAYFDQGEPIYPLAETLLKKYEKRKVFEKLTKKGLIKPIEEVK